jgi:hypothetical protein
MTIPGECGVVVDRTFLTDAFVLASLKDVGYSGFDESFEKAHAMITNGSQDGYPLAGEILDSDNPHLLLLRLHGDSEPLSLAIPWRCVRAVVVLSEARKSKIGFRP